MLLFGIEIDCGKETGFCTGEPRPCNHDNKCCMNCENIYTCRDACLIAKKEMDALNNCDKILHDYYIARDEAQVTPIIKDHYNRLSSF